MRLARRRCPCRDKLPKPCALGTFSHRVWADERGKSSAQTLAPRRGLDIPMSTTSLCPQHSPCFGFYLDRSSRDRARPQSETVWKLQQTDLARTESLTGNKLTCGPFVPSLIALSHLVSTAHLLVSLILLPETEGRQCQDILLGVCVLN